MVDKHANLGADLRQLAETLATLLTPVVQAAAASASASASSEEKPGKCQQVWCPVCAVAAIAAGEPHPLAGLVAEHGVSLLEMIREMAAPTAADVPDDDAVRDDSASSSSSHYQPITVTIVD